MSESTADRRWQRVKDLVDAALDRPAAAREEFLQEACAGDESLREEVDAHLAARDELGDFLSEPAIVEPGPPQAAAAARLPIGTLLGPYEVVSFLGAGGMGEVYKARDTRLGREVAVKVLTGLFAADPDLRERLEREARTISKLSHPHICALYDVGQQDGSSFLVMEYLEGENLADRLRQGPLPVAEALRYATQIAEALAEAHAQGVVHRDLKPANVVLTKSGAKLLDFGIAKLHSASAEDETTRLRTLTRDGLVIGTLQYMAPEQLEGSAVDDKTDIFAFGLLLYEMISGRKAFEAPSGPGLIAAILKHQPPRLSQFQPLTTRAVEGVVRRCLAKEPADRWPSAGELASALRRLADGSASSPWSALPPRSFVLRSIKRHKGVTLLTGLVLILAGVGLARYRPTAPSQAIQSVAVLPLVNALDDPDMDYLADGVTETIIGSLSHLPQLRVMARSTVFTYKGRDIDPRKVGSDLNVRAVLTGRVLQQGDDLVVTAELVDTSDGSRLWGDRYHRRFSDIFAVQEEIAREIVASLRLRLSGEQERQLTKRYTENTEAYQLYLKGRYFWNKRTDEGIKRGIEYFEDAIATDPRYALAHAGLADSYVVMGIWDILPPKETYPMAKEAAMNALELDDRLAEAYTALAGAHMYLDRDLGTAEREYQRAIELSPNYALAHLWYANLLTAMNRPAAALAESKRSQELDPFSLIVNAVAGWTQYVARRQDEGLEGVRKTREMEPTFWPAHWYLGVFYEEKKMYPEAIAAYKRSVELSGGLSRTVASLGHAYAVSGQRERARQVLAELDQLSRRRYVAAYSVAQIHAGLGDKDEAFAWLDKAVEERHGWLIYLGFDPDFSLLRSDPRFAVLMRRLGLQRYWT